MIAHVTKTIPHLIYIDADAFVALTLDSDSNHTIFSFDKHYEQNGYRLFPY